MAYNNQQSGSGLLPGPVRTRFNVTRFKDAIEREITTPKEAAFLKILDATRNLFLTGKSKKRFCRKTPVHLLLERINEISLVAVPAIITSDQTLVDYWEFLDLHTGTSTHLDPSRLIFQIYILLAYCGDNDDEYNRLKMYLIYSWKQASHMELLVYYDSWVEIFGFPGKGFPNDVINMLASGVPTLKAP